MRTIAAWPTRRLRAEAPASARGPDPERVQEPGPAQERVPDRGLELARGQVREPAQGPTSAVQPHRPARPMIPHRLPA